MKKFLFLFAALILSVASAWALDITDLSQVEADAYYTIHCGRGNLAASEDLTKIIGNLDKQTTSNQVAFDAENARFQFQFKEVDGAYYLYNVAAEKYVNNVGNFVETATEAHPIYFRFWSETNTVQPYWDESHNLNLGGSYQVAIGTWMQEDAGDRFQITKLEIVNFDIVVTGCEEGGVTVKDVLYTNGEQTPAIASAWAQVATAQVVEGYDVTVSVEGTTITVTYTQWPEWTVYITGLPEEELMEAGCFYKGNLYINGSTFRASSVSSTDITDPAVVTGYTCNVSVDAEKHTVTLAYTAKRTIDTTKAYYIKNVDSQKYVVIPAPGAGNATISSSEKSKVTFEQVGEGVFTIKGNNGYLGANSWNAIGQADAFNWTVAEYGDDAWTFNQQTAAYKGFLGLDHDGNGVIQEKLYCNKGANNHYAFVLEEAKAEAYTVTITGVAGAVVNYKGEACSNGQSISADEVAASDFEVSGYMYNVNVENNVITINVLAKKVMSLDEISNNKAYYLICGRGQLTTIANEYGTEEGEIVKRVANTDSKYVFWQTGEISYENFESQFAIIKKDGKVYLYSVSVPGFVFNDKSIACEKGAWAAELTEQEGNTFMFKVGGKVLNMQNNASGLIIDNWTTPDGGNMFHICEAGDFDPSAALALINDAGDVDGNGNIELTDLEVLLSIIKGDAEAIGAADLNGDGKVTIGDIAKLIELLNK